MSAAIKLLSKRPVHNRVVLELRVEGNPSIDDVIDAAKRQAGDSMPFGYEVRRAGDLYFIDVYTD